MFFSSGGFNRSLVLFALFVFALVSSNSYANSSFELASSFNRGFLEESYQSQRVVVADASSLVDPLSPIEELFFTGKLLGVGSAGSVKLVKDKDGCMFALKEFELEEESREQFKVHGIDPESYLQRLVKDEWENSLVLDSSRFVQLHHCVMKIDPGSGALRYYILMELVDGGDIE